MTSPAVSRGIDAEALHRAVAVADLAPSAHDVRPWRWLVADNHLDLFVAQAQDAGHVVIVSCGSALHHARLSLAVQGWRVVVERLPDPASPRHLARLRIDGPAPASPGAVRLAAAIGRRHQDPHGDPGRPIRPTVLRNIVQAFHSHDILVYELRPDQILTLGVEAARVTPVGPAEQRWHVQLALWAGAGRIVGPADRRRLPVQQGGHDRAATFLVLHGQGDDDLLRLYAGEALSAGWLVATQHALSVQPFAAPIGQASSREALRSVAPEIDHPYVLVRVGRPGNRRPERGAGRVDRHA